MTSPFNPFNPFNPFHRRPTTVAAALSASAPLHALAAAAALCALLTGCATPPTPAAAPLPAPTAAASAPATVPAAAPAASAPAAVSSVRPPDPTAPKPFAEVSRDAKRQDGFVPLWRKDEKVWLELTPDRFNKPLLFSVNVAQSVGERGLYGSQMGRSWLVEFRRIGNQVQLLARQLGYRGEGDPATRLAVAEGFSDSLLGATPVASADHPERKSVLVDASFLLGDILGYSTALEGAYRMPFTPDRGNSYFDSARAEAGLTTLSAKVHYAVPRIAAPPAVPVPPGAGPMPPQATPDPRSFFVGFVYNFRELPAEPMATRRADPRVGYFTSSYVDLSNDFRANPRIHSINRWRLEKKDPAAAVSEPVKPITYWLDKNIPTRYRAAITAGVLEWNKAFEKIGFKDAIVAKQQPDDADFNTMDASHASIRWFVGADVGFAIGPSHVDPRSGEILDADIGMSDVFGRGQRRLLRDDVAGGTPLSSAAAPARQAMAAFGGVGAELAGADCSYAAEGAQQLEFALDLLAARGELDPDSPETEAVVQDYIKDVITHEVGHTLGLRHNFKASTTIPREQLKDKARSSVAGISGSVMDYNPMNLPLAGEPRSQFNMVTLGAYDEWAIAYGYGRAAPDAGQEATRLQALAARGQTERALTFADDIDAGGFAGNDGLDPLANRFDLGDDPLAYYQRRLALSKELWERVQQRKPQPGDDPERARRSVLAGFRQMGPLPALAAKYVGGMYTERDLPGTGRPAFRPVEPARQRAALQFLTTDVFGVDSFRFRPEFLASLSPDYIDFTRAGPLSVSGAVLNFQVGALDRLLDVGTARRLLELPNYLPENQRRGAISLHEVYDTLQGAVWSELRSGREIDAQRRSLQREHLKRLQVLLTRPPAALPADAVSLARLNAVNLQARLRGAIAARPGMAVENRAHLEEALSTLTEALKATMQRSL